MGDALRSIHPETLVRGWLADASILLDAGVRVVTPDIRTPLEVAILRRAGGMLWRVRRGETGLRGAVAEHLTETALDDLRDPDAEIQNDGTVAELRSRIDDLLTALGM
jgi:hypothetical protein